jgi:TraB/PrgY/gumN family
MNNSNFDHRGALALCLALYAATASAAEPADPFARAAAIQQEVADIRGLPFKQPVPMEKQTPEGLIRHMEREAGNSMPDASEKHFDKIVRRLGLYRGPPIEDFSNMIQSVMTSQVAAYYDSDTKRVYLLNEGSNALEQGVVYSHELYHALQDQYFDLDSFVSGKLKLDSDQTLSRVAVVEGEATYMHTLWGIKQMMKQPPPRALVAPIIQAQADVDVAQLMAMSGASAKDKAEADAIPPFILEVMIGNYMKGAAFIFALQDKDWTNVEKLYKEYPPQSTEQILHPEKWLAREGPATIRWQDLGKDRALKDWELIDDDVIGEAQWRIIFKVQGLAADAKAAAAGWNGDRYAVLKRKKSDETLLLLRTSWDSEAEATEFVEAYRRVLVAKYQGTPEATQVEQHGAEVFIVEGGRKEDLAAMMKIVKSANQKPGASAGAAVVSALSPLSGAKLDELDPVLVTGERPGPALWKVTRKGKDNVLWILPTFEPLPDSLVLRSAELEKVIKDSQSVYFLRKVNPPSSFSEDPRTKSATQNVAGKRLEDVVAPELYQQFRSLTDRYASGSEMVNIYRPVIAADWLKQMARRRLQLTDRSVYNTIVGLAKKYDVKIWTVIMKYPETWDRKIAKLEQAPREGDAACAKAKLDRLEPDLKEVVRRANAWADGNITALLADKDLYDTQLEPKVCEKYFNDIKVGSLQPRPDKGWAYRSAVGHFKTNHSTLAIVPIVDLFEKNGLIARLKRAGYQVEPPPSLSLASMEE